jgi:hypothetical protein
MSYSNAFNFWGYLYQNIMKKELFQLRVMNNNTLFIEDNYMGFMAFLDEITDIEDAEYDGFEDDLLKDKKEEEEQENRDNKVPHDEIIENN